MSSRVRIFPKQGIKKLFVYFAKDPISYPILGMLGAVFGLAGLTIYREYVLNPEIFIKKGYFNPPLKYPHALSIADPNFDYKKFKLFTPLKLHITSPVSNKD